MINRRNWELTEKTIEKREDENRRVKEAEFVEMIWDFLYC